MSEAATVLRVLSFRHNRIEAAAQDYELAKVQYREVCESFEAADERSVGRFHAAIDRRRSAWDRWIFHRFGG